MKPLIVLASFIAFILSLAVVPLAAQERTETPAEACAADTQTWYDGLDPANVFPNSFEVIFRQDSKQLDKVTALQNIQHYVDLVKASAPDCASVAQGWYLDAMSKVVADAQSVINNALEFPYNFGVIYEEVGEFRGYLVALGVHVDMSGKTGAYMDMPGDTGVYLK